MGLDVGKPLNNHIDGELVTALDRTTFAGDCYG